MQLPTIRTMTPADADPTADAIQRSGWGGRHVKMAFVAHHPQCRPFVAEADGAIVGTGVTTLNGPVAWIGTIWVDPAWRGRGLGKALTRATIDAADGAGCRALVLVATDAGRPLYERFGFEVQTHYRILEAPGLVSEEADPRIRPYQPSDLADMSTMDATATGEDRAHLLGAFAAPERTRCLRRADGSLGGYVLRPPWGGGATIAPDPDDALAILHARRIASGPERRVRAGLLETNEAGIERLLALGWVDAWGAPRMVRGEMPAWQPNAIWGQFDHAVG
ncbi:MAG TPA: GNAT family N-acetyltransferase [Candidatus Limnocylindrales bacterium]|nr:GNAT family N-acetyltransferase [Candidatus Limnocylindrales bacterium]